jgi:hypothetical protein
MILSVIYQQEYYSYNTERMFCSLTTQKFHTKAEQKWEIEGYLDSV